MVMMEESMMRKLVHTKKRPNTCRRSKSLFLKVSETFSPWIRTDLHVYALVPRVLMAGKTLVNLLTELRSEAW